MLNQSQLYIRKKLSAAKAFRTPTIKEYRFWTINNALFWSKTIDRIWPECGDDLYYGMSTFKNTSVQSIVGS